MYTHSLKNRTEFTTVTILGSGAAHEYSNAEQTCKMWGRIGLDSVIYRRDCIVSFWYKLFYGVRLVSRPTPNWYTITFDLSGMGDRTSSYATASIALRII
jgi:hypothetical protein